MARPGLHWPNQTSDDPAARARFLAGRFSSAVVMTVTPASVVSWLLEVVGVRLVVARIYEPAGDLSAPADVAQRHEPWIRACGRGVEVQILNEPDLEYPSVSPEAFAVWWLACASALRSSFPGLVVGFPAPSIGASDEYWSRVIGTGVLAHADFIGERAYWQLAADAGSSAFGGRWRRSAALGRPIYLTEFGCSFAGTPKVTKAVEYLDFCRSLPRFVAPVGAFIGAGGDPRWDSPGSGFLWIDDEMSRRIGAGERVARVDPIVLKQVLSFGPQIVSAANARSISPSLVAGLIAVESGGSERAVSPDNGPGLGHAVGLMQVLQGHFAQGDDPFDAATNLRVGCGILRKNLDIYTTLAGALAAYFGAVDSAGNPTSGTDVTGTTGIQYVEEVEGAAKGFAELDGPGPAPVLPVGGLADSDFAAYAPKTGTWREACTNLKGVADDALGAGRKIVADCVSIWGAR